MRAHIIDECRGRTSAPDVAAASLAANLVEEHPAPSVHGARWRKQRARAI